MVKVGPFVLCDGCFSIKFVNNGLYTVDGAVSHKSKVYKELLDKYKRL
jgi:hypothetical protein